MFKIFGLLYSFLGTGVQDFEQTTVFGDILCTRHGNLVHLLHGDIFCSV